MRDMPRGKGRKDVDGGQLPRDPQALEALSSSVSRGLRETRSVTRDRAQELIYDAWELEGTQRIALAHRALAAWPDCADAYVILAEETGHTLEAKLALYEAGVAAGERALGAGFFQEEVGYFWGLLETRPYMRARAGLAAVLYHLGEKQRAADHYRDLLRLNPSDNQGIRYVLLPCLLELGSDEQATQLLRRYKSDVAATWAYGRALLVFRSDGSGQRSHALLDKAIAANPFVPAYLLGRKRLPDAMPPYIGIGDQSEAISCADDLLEAWRATGGALQWLGARVASRVANGRRPQGGGN